MDKILLSYGLPGVCILGLALFVLKLMADHRKEREEWREDQKKTQEKQFDRINEMSDESNKVLRENSNILSGLKSLLENNRK